jgi:hypothetical protein
MYLVLSVHTSNAGLSVAVFGMEPPQKACRTPYSRRMVRYWHTLIHTQARHLRPIAAGGAVDVFIPPKYARCSVFACCWRRESRLTPCAYSRRPRRALVRLVLCSHTRLRVVCRKEGTRRPNGTSRIARLGISSPAARSCQPSCASRLHFTTLQPITALSVAMHKLAIHSGNRVHQSCASRA